MSETPVTKDQIVGWCMPDESAAAASQPEKTEYVHELTLEFGRVLTEDEWREISDAAKELPYVKLLRASAIPQHRCGPDGDCAECAERRDV